MRLRTEPASGFGLMVTIHRAGLMGAAPRAGKGTR